jgi:hypothetical protein
MIFRRNDNFRTGIQNGCFFMVRIICGFILMVTVFVTALCCGIRKELPNQIGKVEIRNDEKGRVIYRRFDQVIEHNHRRYVATITQEFDSAGRVTVEYGTDHPRLGKQYFLDVFYAADMKFRVVNYFRWAEEQDTASLNVLPLSAFVEQKIVIDTAGFLKTIIIKKLKNVKGSFIGLYTEEGPLPAPEFAGPSNYYHSYRFKLPLQDLRFDSEKRLVLKNAVRLQD